MPDMTLNRAGAESKGKASGVRKRSPQGQARSRTDRVLENVAVSVPAGIAASALWDGIKALFQSRDNQDAGSSAVSVVKKADALTVESFDDRWRPVAAMSHRRDAHVSRFISELQEILRYGPKGRIEYFSADQAHEVLALFLLDIFRSVGWRDHGRVELGRTHVRDRPPLILVFSLSDRHQISNARRAIEELLAKCGFVATSEHQTYRSTDEKHDRILCIFHSHQR